MTWRVVFTATARHVMKRIPRAAAHAIGEELASVAGEPDPKRFVKRLQGSHNLPFYSLRVGDCRAILSIVDDLVIIHVVDVGYRGSVYRKY